MKKLAVIAVLLTAMAPTVSHAADDHDAKHGGIMVPGKEADYELVAKPDTVLLYVYDHGKPMDVSKASAKLTLLAGSVKQEVNLVPMGDKLEAKGTFKVAAGTKVVAVVTNGGKTLGTARFTLK